MAKLAWLLAADDDCLEVDVRRRIVSLLVHGADQWI
jgi:hypothetical protein